MRVNKLKEHYTQTEEMSGKCRGHLYQVRAGVQVLYISIVVS